MRRNEIHPKVVAIAVSRAVNPLDRNPANRQFISEWEQPPSEKKNGNERDGFYGFGNNKERGSFDKQALLDDSKKEPAKNENKAKEEKKNEPPAETSIYLG